jgi:hypothetical protein
MLARRINMSSSSNTKKNKKQIIDKLTPEQEAMMPIYVERCTAIGRTTQTWDQFTAPDNQAAIRSLITEIYTNGGVTMPTDIRLVRNPQEGIDLVSSLTGNTKYSTLNQSCYGSHDISWLSFYMFCHYELNLREETARLKPFWELATKCGWWWPLSGAVVISPMPSALRLDKQGRLHAEGEAAVDYSSQPFVYALHGVRFPVEMAIKWVVPPVSELPIDQVLSITNTEQRREIIKRIGIQNMWKQLNPRMLDTATIAGNSYQLHEISLTGNASNDRMNRIYLQMLNPSVIGEIHIEGVHPDCRTVEQALNWRNFGTVDVSTGRFVPPQVLT